MNLERTGSELNADSGPATITRLQFVVTCASPPAGSFPRVTPCPLTARFQKVLPLVHAHTASQGHSQAASAHAGRPQVLPPPKLHQLPPPTTGAPAGCWGSTHPLLSAPLASSSGSAPGLRNPALDWGPTPCPGPAGRSSWGLAGALPTGRPSPCPSQVTVPGHWAPFPLDPEPSQRPMCLSGGVQTSLSTPLSH